MPERNAAEVADLLEEIGRRAAFESGNPFKVKAYLRAAGSLRRLIQPLDEVIRQGALQTIPGVGQAIARRIEALHRGETDAALERMRARLTAGLLGMLTVPGLRPATILKLYEKLGVASLADLAAACRDGKVGTTKGLGSSLERKILQGLAIAREGAGRLRMHQAQAILDQTIAELRRLRSGLSKLTIAGDLRRACELVSDLRLVAVDRQAAAVIAETFGPVTLHTCPADLFGVALVQATGSERHVRQLADAARRRRLTLGPDGLCTGARRVRTLREADVYAALGPP
jgi:DNA polymerase (family 10)